MIKNNTKKQEIKLEIKKDIYLEKLEEIIKVITELKDTLKSSEEYIRIVAETLSGTKSK